MCGGTLDWLGGGMYAQLAPSMLEPLMLHTEPLGLLRCSDGGGGGC